MRKSCGKPATPSSGTLCSLLHRGQVTVLPGLGTFPNHTVTRGCLEAIS